MKLKIKQNLYILEVKRLVDVNEVLELSTEVGQDLIKAGYAEEVVVEKEKKVRKKVGENE